MSGRDKTIEVYADWRGLDHTSRVGILFAQYVRGKEIVSFEYDDAWLRRNDNRVLDPRVEAL